MSTNIACKSSWHVPILVKLKNILQSFKFMIMQKFSPNKSLGLIKQLSINRFQPFQAKGEVCVCVCAWFFFDKVCSFPKFFQGFTIALCVCLYKSAQTQSPWKLQKGVWGEFSLTIKHFFLSFYVLQCVSIASKAPQIKSQSLKLDFNVCFV
jgi:hypothetical protein